MMASAQGMVAKRSVVRWWASRLNSPACTAIVYQVLLQKTGGLWSRLMVLAQT